VGESAGSGEKLGKKQGKGWKSRQELRKRGLQWLSPRNAQPSFLDGEVACAAAQRGGKPAAQRASHHPPTSRLARNGYEEG